MKRILFASLALSVSVACQNKHQGTYELEAAASTGSDASAVIAEADALWEQRGDAAQLEAALAKYEEAWNLDPKNRHVSQRLTRGFYFLGDGHKTEMADKLAAWDTSITWGKKCLALNEEFVAILEKGDEAEDMAVRVATADDVPCLYWSASALGKWAKASGLGKTLKNLPIVKAYQTKVTELDPDYFYGGPDRYWGAYYAAIPSFAGQDLGKSKEHLDASLASHNDYLGTHVIVAEYWAVKSQDGETFTRELEWVLAQSPDIIPELRPEHEAEQRKAKALLERKAELILEG